MTNKDVFTKAFTRYFTPDLVEKIKEARKDLGRDPLRPNPIELPIHFYNLDTYFTGETPNNQEETTMTETPAYDVEAVEFPKHYKFFEEDSIVHIARTMPVEGFRCYCRGSAQKYRYRAGKKGNDKALEDIAKALEFEKLFTKYKVYCYDYKAS